MFKLKNWQLAIPLMLVSSFSQALSLQSILQSSLQNDPDVREAAANIESAHMRTEQAKGQHWPIISLTGNKLLSQYHDDKSDYNKKSFVPGVKGEINLYSFGAIDAEVDRNLMESRYYQHQFNATKEEVGYTIAELYLRALMAKEAIGVMKKSLARHEAILNDIGAITDSDIGRESEYVQAEARLLMVEQDINNYERELASTLTSLAKYIKHNIDSKELEDPFKQVNIQTLLAAYAGSRETNPTYQAQQAQLDTARADQKLEQRKRLPKLNLVGSATTEDRTLGLSVSWDILNNPASYVVREKATILAAAHERLDRVSRDIEDSARLAQVNIEQYQRQLKTLKAQAISSAKVVEFYKLQFDIARRTLLDVLNAERELFNVELSQVMTTNSLRTSILEYLRSQGMLASWAGVKPSGVVELNFK
ncbi:adhesin transport system outer membrane protein [Cricetibacter osteomyelitidis]|uniref:Adhesin transport system outer membrane protein n=1 Tax=Cricetibacter osteomyelitidis TaxID=1521931 RepID=A0A4R2SIC4_9PAST|nr:TolC family protein [Cricetibacter osteomyelitidis]TCP88810.1 adhesin transport system outer membrane protein [Cricetibacter osteomyelitidis]